jgi:hypothetical protein
MMVEVQLKSLSQTVWQSFMSELGSIVFGMEDGTVLMLLWLGVGRGIIAHKKVVVTALQTLAIGATAGVAGLLVGSLITRQLSG